jgi:hypothetical protein
MNHEQVWSAIRQVMLILGGALVTKGWVDGGTVEAVVGALCSLGASVWAFYTRRNNGLITSAANLPEVKGVTVKTQAQADSLPANVTKA